MNQSILSICLGGELALIGFVAQDAVAIDFFSLFKSTARFRVISVGSRDDFEQMSRAFTQHKIMPVIGRLPKPNWPGSVLIHVSMLGK